jgi:hypothetical protein
VPLLPPLLPPWESLEPALSPTAQAVVPQVRLPRP